MNSPQMLGLVGGIAGGVLGLLGGAIGTYFSIKNTRTEAERRFIIRCTVACWVPMLLLLVAPMPLVVLKILPAWPIQIVSLAFLGIGVSLIPRLNRRANELRGSSQPMQSS